MTLGKSAKETPLDEDGDKKKIQLNLDTIFSDREALWSPNTKKVQTLEMGTMAGKRTPPSTPVRLIKKYEEEAAIALSPKKIGKKVLAAAGSEKVEKVDDDDENNDFLWGGEKKKSGDGGSGEKKTKSISRRTW